MPAAGASREARNHYGEWRCEVAVTDEDTPRAQVGHDVPCCTVTIFERLAVPCPVHLVEGHRKFPSS